MSTNAAAQKAATPLPTLNKLLYDRKSAAYALSISIRSLDYLVSEKKLAFRRFGKKVLISHAELLKFARGKDDVLTLSGAAA